MNKSKSLFKYLLVLFSIVISVSNLSADNDSGDYMSNIGKIYVVIAVIVVIFLGIFAFLLILEKRLKKLENQNPNNE
ncbi:MAG TPA: hypothetical protein VK590_15010 [Saprospiraceae bacterium]|nr:hypothetical protein [Saprospiraceae bacterium]